MKVLVALLVASVGCNGKDDNPTQLNETGGPTGPVFFDLKATTTAKGFEAEVVPEAIKAHQISSTLLASTSLVVADQKVQDRLNTNGGGGELLRAAPLQCWYRPQYPMFSFAIDYTGCEAQYGISGGVFVNDHPSGPLLFEFNNFQIQADATVREIGGVLALDTRNAFPEPLYWNAYNTDGDNPGLKNPVQLGIGLDRETFGLSYSAGASVDFLNQEWAMWGVATIGVGKESITVVHGGRVPEDVSPSEPTGTDVLKSSLNWLDCRCPTSGVQALDMPLRFSSVTVDVDDLEVEPDGIDDPDVQIPVDYELFGQGVLTHTGCGTYDVEYQTQAVEIPVPVNQLVGAVSFLCATFEIADEQRCGALVAAAGGLGEDLKVQVSQEEATAVALAAVEADFDTTWCNIY